MKLLRSLPSNRSFESIKKQYLLEKSIAQRLKESSREERKLIYATMYEEVFSQVPDHPRLTRRNSEQLTITANKSKFYLVQDFLDKSVTFAEFAPGDCRFSLEVAKHVKCVYGIDISDQRNPADKIPKNFKLIVYDGYDLREIDNNSIDIIFSDQLIEHFHPEDTRLHFELVHRILKPNGKYVFRTPHFLAGPWDVSKYFSDEPEGFHLKEWTYTEIKTMLRDLHYSSFYTHWCAKGINLRLPYNYFETCERILGSLPKRYIRKVARCLMPSICGIAIK